MIIKHSDGSAVHPNGGFRNSMSFVLACVGSAVGMGNIWLFPYRLGQYGGAAFILIYLFFLVIFGLPIMTMEFSVGRASRRSIADSFRVLEPKGTKWHAFGWIGMAGNYLLMKGDLKSEDIVELMKRTFNFVANFEGEIPGAAPKDCGNWLLHDLPMARWEARKYVDEVLENAQPANLNYPG